MGEPLTDSQSTSGVGQRPQGLRVGSPAQQDPLDYDPLINAHAALVLVSAAVIGLVVGVLTFLGTANAPSPPSSACPPAAQQWECCTR